MNHTIRKWREKKINIRKEKNIVLEARKKFFGIYDPEYINWCYENNPSGEALIYMALTDNDIAGQRVIIPHRFLMGGKLFSIGLLLNVHTNTKFRRQGIFTKLTQISFEDMKELGYPFAISWPNQLSRPGHLNKLGFTEPLQIFNFVRPPFFLQNKFDFPNIANIGSRIKSRDIDILSTQSKYKETKSIDLFWVEKLWNDYCKNTKMSLVKDSKWTEWRYLNNPDIDYRFLVSSTLKNKPQGYLVYRKEHRKLFGKSVYTIVDIFSKTNIVMFALLKNFIDMFESEKVFLKSFAALFTPYSVCLMRNGFLPFRKISMTMKVFDESIALLHINKRNLWNVNPSYSNII